MTIRIHIYNIHDRDLLYLIETGSINMSSALKTALKAFFSGNCGRIDYEVKVMNVDEGKRPKRSRHIKLDISDQDIPGIEEKLRCLIKNRMCTAFCKNVLRNYLGVVPVSAYFPGAESVFHNIENMVLQAEKPRRKNTIKRKDELPENGSPAEEYKNSENATAKDDEKPQNTGNSVANTDIIFNALNDLHRSQPLNEMKETVKAVAAQDMDASAETDVLDTSVSEDDLLGWFNNM